MGGGPPCTVFGLAVHNGEQHLARALESLLTQTRADLAVLVLDDRSTDRTAEIAHRYAKLDGRVVYEQNDEQLGLARAWRRAFDVARRLYPGAEYFAWASDHDVWHPRWLEVLAAELDGHPSAVLAHPQFVRIDDFGSEYPTRAHALETVGLTERRARLRRASREMTAAGSVIYGLMRTAALERCGGFPQVLVPDRLQLLRLALEGEFRQVQRPLWYRRYRAGIVQTNKRQRSTSFLGRPPLWAYAPWWLTHTFLFFRSLEGDPSRLRLASLFLYESLRHERERRRERAGRERRWRRRGRRRRYRGLVRPAARRFRLSASSETVVSPPQDSNPGPEGGPDSPAPSDVLVALEHAGLLDDLAGPDAVAVSLGETPAQLEEELRARNPALEWVVLRTDEPGAELERADLALSIGSLENLAAEEALGCARRLHELGVPVLYSLDRESSGVRAALDRWYWLHDLWSPALWADGQARKPDPVVGAVPHPVGRYRHLVGRRRLIPEQGVRGEPEATMRP